MRFPKIKTYCYVNRATQTRMSGLQQHGSAKPTSRTDNAMNNKVEPKHSEYDKEQQLYAVKRKTSRGGRRDR